MGWFSDDSDQAQAYDQFTNAPNHQKVKLSHELIAAAAAYEADKAYNDHVAENGKPTSHAKAKEIFAGFAGAFLDREFEKHGSDGVAFLKNEKDKLLQGVHGHADEYLQSDEY